MKNENNIINQIIQDNIKKKENGENVEQTSWLQIMQEVYNTYINTLNNESEVYKNTEDRKIYIEKIFKASDFSFCISELEELEIGHCCRETYFRFKNSYQDNVTSKVTEDIEKNMLSKEQFLRKLKLVDIYKEPENTIVNTFGLNIETTEDGFIYDYERDKEYILLIKPVNDSVGIIKNKVWNKFNAKPLSYHIPEIMLNMFLIRKPLKLIYVGKNNSELYKEFNFGFQDSCLSIDNNKIPEYDLSYLLDKIKLFEKHIEKDVIPRKIFTDKSLGMDEINNMQSYGLIEDFEINKLLNGEMYKNFQCNSCKYKTICENC